MFAAFDLNLEDAAFQDYFAVGNRILEENKRTVSSTLSRYIRPDYSIDGEDLQEDWFGSVKADVFLSHSHDDLDLALGVAGWLRESFKLDAFVDSAFWGYSLDLLEQINNEYNTWERDEDGSPITYGHAGAVRAAGHVDMMLATALLKMIKRCECMFFINTENTIIPARPQSETLSPWIYFENVVANQLPHVPPDRHTDLWHAANESVEFRVAHPMDLSEFIYLDIDDLKEWGKCGKKRGAALDALYREFGLLHSYL